MQAAPADPLARLRPSPAANSAPAATSPQPAPSPNPVQPSGGAAPVAPPRVMPATPGDRQPGNPSGATAGPAAMIQKTEATPMTNTATAATAPKQAGDRETASLPPPAAKPVPAPQAAAPQVAAPQVAAPSAPAVAPLPKPAPAQASESPKNTVEAALEKAEIAWSEAEADAQKATAAKAAIAKAGPDAPAAREAAAVALRKAEIAWKAAAVEMELVTSAKGARNAPKAWSKEVEARTDAARKKAEVALKAAGVDIAPPVVRAPPKPGARPAAKPAMEIAPKPKRRRKFWSAVKISFALAVLLPTVLVGLYYMFFASDQYRSEMRFAIRGTERSTLENLGLAAIPGASSQAPDAYIVIDYIHSKQVLKDIQQKLGIDMRQYFAKPEIDFWYRTDASMPLDEFIDYWRWMIDASFNSTTSITTFEISAFTAEDAQQIADAVLRVSDELVNELSAKAREQLIKNAEVEVQRTEDRLANARKVVESFRNKIQAADPSAIAESDQRLLSEMESALIELKTRRSALLETVDINAPSVRVIDREINARTAELELKRGSIGSGTSAVPGTSLSSQLSEYNALMLEQEFAEKAYTTALASLETSQAEARRQERYFAIVVEPSTPEIALHPLGVLNTLVAFASLCLLWLIGYLVAQSIRDHTI
jgi:capsular polysaccharide transport system permease protein